MNTSFEKSKNSTDEWYTPKEIIDALGKFDLDPCAPMRPLWRTARVMYNKEQDGLKQKWEGKGMVKPTLFKTDYRAFYYSYGRAQ